MAPATDPPHAHQEIPGSVGSFEVRIPCDALSPAGLAFRVFYPARVDTLPTRYKPVDPVPGATLAQRVKYAAGAFSYLGWSGLLAYPIVAASSLGMVNYPAPLVREGSCQPRIPADDGDESPPRPVIFAHGLGGSMNAYMRYASSLANRTGAVVFALEFADGSAAASLRHDGNWVSLRREMDATREELEVLRNDQMVSKATEINQLIALLEQWNSQEQESSGIPAPLIPLRGLFSPDNGVDLVGHSMGCPPVLIAAAQSKTVRNVVLLDPWWMNIHEAPWKASRAPVMIWLNGMWQWKSNLSKIKQVADSMRAENVNVAVVEGERTHHGDQADFCFVLPGTFRKSKGGKEPLHLSLAMEFSIEASRAFLHGRLPEWFSDQEVPLEEANIRLLAEVPVPE